MMSSEEMELRRGSAGRPSAKRTGAAFALAALLLTSGVVVGRATAPAQVRAPVPTTTRVNLGAPSVGDLRRAEMFKAMNGLRSVSPNEISRT
jgi:hypothetical protein